jgi:hypothetical protein
LESSRDVLLDVVMLRDRSGRTDENREIGQISMGTAYRVSGAPTSKADLGIPTNTNKSTSSNSTYRSTITKLGHISDAESEIKIVSNPRSGSAICDPRRAATRKQIGSSRGVNVRASGNGAPSGRCGLGTSGLTKIVEYEAQLREHFARVLNNDNPEPLGPSTPARISRMQ